MMINQIYYLIEPKKFELKTMEMSPLNSKYVRLKNLFCGICGGDYSCFLGHRNSYPYTLGHEFVAEVVDVGDNVTQFKQGDYVISDFNYRCGECEYCLSGKDHLCINNDIQLFSNRAFSKFSDVHQSYLYKVYPKNIIEATLIEPLSCIIHAWNLIEKHVIPQKILIVGLGNIGTLFSFLSKKIKGLNDVFVYDTNASKLNNVVNFFDCIPYDKKEMSSFDVIIDASNTIEGISFSLNRCRQNQLLCVMSHLYGINTSYIYESLCKKEIFSIFPLRNGNIVNLSDADLFIKNHWNSQYNDMIGIYSINDIQNIFENKSSNIYNKQVFCIDL